MEQQSKLVNIVGVDTPDVGLKQLQANQTPQIEDIADQKFQEAEQNIARMYEERLQQMQERARAKIASNAALDGKSDTFTKIAELGGSIIEGIQGYQQAEAERKQAEAEAQREAIKQQREDAKYAADMADDERKRQAEARKELQADNAVIARAAVQQQVLALESNVQQYGEEEGIHITRKNAEDAIAALESQYDLSPETRTQLRDIVFSQIDAASSRQTSRVFNKQEQLSDQQTAARRSQIQMTLTPALMQLKTARTQEEADQILTAIGQQILPLTEGLSDLDKLNTVVPLLQKAAENYEAGTAGAQAIQRNLQALETFRQSLPEARAQFGDNPDDYEMYVQSQQIAAGVDPGLINTSKYGNNLDIRKKAVEYNNVNQELLQFAQQQNNQELMRTQQDYVAGASTDLAWRMFNGDAQAQNYYQYVKNNAGKDTSITVVDQLAVQRVDEWKKAQEDFQQGNRRVADLLGQKASLIQRFSQNKVELERDPITRNPTGNLLGVPTAPEYDAATKSQLDVLDQQIQAEQFQLQSIAQQAASTGLNVLNPRDNSLVQQITTGIAAGQQARDQIQPLTQGIAGSVGGGTSGLPNFNQPAAPAPTAQSRRLQNAREESGVIMPIPQGYDVGVTDWFDETGDNAHEWAVDIGSYDSGKDVPVVAIRGGKVLFAEDWGGYGGSVTVRTPSGEVEQYSHMRRFDVKPGDTIAPGQALGLMGGGSGDPMAGHSTGRHIHFEVYSANASDDSIGRPGAPRIPAQQYLKDSDAWLKQNGNNAIPPSSPTGFGLPPTQGLMSIFTPQQAPMQTSNGFVFPNFTGALFGGSTGAFHSLPMVQPNAAARQTNQAVPVSPAAPGAKARRIPGGVANTNISATEASVLDAIAAHEAGGYDVMFTGAKFTPTGGHPRRLMSSGGLSSDAAGRYQFLSTTWDSYNGGNDDMSPANQDAVALRLIRDKRGAGGIFQAIESGDYNTFKNIVANKLAPEWASVPVDETGKGYYPGQSGWGSIREMWNYIQKRRGEYAGVATQPVPASNVMNPSAPAITPNASGNKTDYGEKLGNDPANNYGYSKLTIDRGLRIALAQGANRIGVPAMWLADVFSAATNGTFKSNNPSEHAADNFNTQFLARLESAKRETGKSYRTIEDVLAVLVGGSELLAMTPAQRLNYRTRRGTFGQMLNQLGNSVGRIYRTSSQVAASAAQPVQTAAGASQPSGQWVLPNGKTAAKGANGGLPESRTPSNFSEAITGSRSARGD